MWGDGASQLCGVKGHRAECSSQGSLCRRKMQQKAVPANKRLQQRLFCFRWDFYGEKKP